MFKTKSQKRRIAQLDELIEIAKKINEGVLTHKFKHPTDPVFDQLFCEYTSKLDKISSEILTMGKIRAFFFSGPLLRRLMKLRAWNNFIVAWMGTNYRTTQLKTSEQ